MTRGDLQEELWLSTYADNSAEVVVINFKDKVAQVIAEVVYTAASVAAVCLGFLVQCTVHYVFVLSLNCLLLPSLGCGWEMYGHIPVCDT